MHIAVSVCLSDRLLRAKTVEPIKLVFFSTQRRVEFKIACLVHQSLASLAPTYLTTDIHLLSEVGSSPSALIC